MRCLSLIYLCAFLAAGLEAQADSASSSRAGRFSTQAWCEDDLTICASSRESRRTFSGVRIVFEPQLGVLFQSGETGWRTPVFARWSVLVSRPT